MTMAELEQENKRLTAALQHIADPIGYLRKEAESKCCQLDGIWAIRYSDSADTLKQVAKRAIHHDQPKNSDC